MMGILNWFKYLWLKLFNHYKSITMTKDHTLDASTKTNLYNSCSSSETFIKNNIKNNNLTSIEREYYEDIK